MTFYLHQANYSNESMKGLISSPENRKEAVAGLFEAAGGTLVDAWMAFGEYDIIVISKFDDHVDAASVAMAIASSGSLSNLKTTLIYHCRNYGLNWGHSFFQFKVLSFTVLISMQKSDFC